MARKAEELPSAYQAARIGERLRGFRDERRLKQEEIARVLGTSSNLVSQYETGRRRLTLDQAVKLIRRYPDLSLDWLFLDKGSRPTGPIDQRIDQVERQLSDLNDDVRILKRTIGEAPSGKAMRQVGAGDPSASNEVAKLSGGKEGKDGRTGEQHVFAKKDVVRVP